ncbi:MAG: RNA polymerase sigma factor [Phycisphaerales bacterium]
MMIAMSLHSVPDDAAHPATERASALVARAAQGDEESWNALAAMYARRLFALARSRLHDDQLAEDIAQSVFVTLAEKLKGPDGAGYTEQGRFESWLFRVAMNRIRDVARKQRRRREVLTAAPPDRAPGADPQAEPTEDLDALRSAMRQLSDQDREVVELRHHAGLSFKHIAETLDQPLGTVLARHHRALRKLKELIESHQTPAHQQVTP